MAMTDAQLRSVAVELARRIFVTAAATAHSDLDDLKLAIQKIDTAMNATTTQVEAAAPGVVLKVALRDEIQTAAANLTNSEAGIAVAYWALKETGLI